MFDFFKAFDCTCCHKSGADEVNSSIVVSPAAKGKDDLGFKAPMLVTEATGKVAQQADSGFLSETQNGSATPREEAHGRSMVRQKTEVLKQSLLQTGLIINDDGSVAVADTEELARAVSRMATESQPAKRSRSVQQSQRPAFHGTWTCTATWGLDDFLKANGIGAMQRMIAAKAPWPSWEFEQDGDHFVFINHSMVGDLREEFEVGGPEYETIDGKQQRLTCKAWWEGQTLVIHRSGPQGEFREERLIDKEELHFKLMGLNTKDSTSWGRTFKRK